MKTINHFLKVLLACLVLSLFSVASQADPGYTQYYSTPLELNPALMGGNQYMDVTLNYRRQWTGISDGFINYRGTFMMPIIANEGGKLDAGLSVYKDEAGAYSTMNYALAVGYDLKFMQGHHFSAAIYTGYRETTLSTTDLMFGDQYVDGSYDATNPTSETLASEKSTLIDAGFGFLWYYQPESVGDGSLGAFAGFSGYHFHGADQTYIENGENDLKAKYNYITGVKMISGSGVDIAPNLRVISQGGSYDIATGLYTDIRPMDGYKFTLGAWYKDNKTVSVIIGAKMSSFGIGYSYDFAASPLSKTAFGTSTHEVSLSFLMKQTDADTPVPFSLW